MIDMIGPGGHSSSYFLSDRRGVLTSTAYWLAMSRNMLLHFFLSTAQPWCGNVFLYTFLSISVFYSQFL